MQNTDGILRTPEDMKREEDRVRGQLNGSLAADLPMADRYPVDQIAATLGAYQDGLAATNIADSVVDLLVEHLGRQIHDALRQIDVLEATP